MYQPTFIQAMLGNKSYQPSNLIDTYLILKFLGDFESATALLDLAVFYMSSHSMYGKLLQSCLTLCYPIDSSPPGSPVPGILQARHWSGLPFPSPMRESEVAQSCLTLHDPMDCSLPGSSIHGIFQARVLEWGAIAFSDYMC